MFKSAPFTSDTFTTSEDGFPVGNRPVYSDGQRAFNKAVVTDGVPFEPSDNLEVTAAGGMDVSVAVGLIIKNGAWGYLDAAKTITLSTSSSDQVIYIGVRAAAADAYFIGDDIAAYTTFVSSTDCAVARINIPANATAVTAGMITSLRGNATYCGYVNDLLLQAQNAIQAFNENGVPTHASTHAYSGTDPLSASDIGQYGVAPLNSGSVVNPAYDYVPINAQTDSYTAALTDVGKDVWVTNASAKTFTIPPQSSVTWLANSYMFVTRGGAGTVTITAGAGVTINSAGARLKIAEQYGTVMIRRTAENVWLLTGSTSA